ncbi:MAG: UDP-glucose 4-epimerase GalE [Saprospiraceae bacterium]|nr:UDP-glucose 4-epimerase GalE [Saprospiraceae bacterium]
MSRILVTGGCGYIGSHTIVDLLDNGYEVLCLDSLINASPECLEGIREITGKTIRNHLVDLTKTHEVDSFFQNQDPIDGVIHFAALKAVGESVEKPMLYFKNNVNGMINLLEACVKFGVKHFVFSSSCTVYGDPDQLPVTETSPFKPAESPYGRTKQIGEMLLEDICRLTPLRGVSLRYFNPAGAHPSSEIGESPVNPALNLVPIITETAIGLRDQIKVFGNDYDTRDGTCIRDYIHVSDLAHAHTLALKYLDENEMDLEVFNLGTGNGVSVLEAIHAFEAVNGLKLKYSMSERRPGDVPAIYSDNKKAREDLGWRPEKDINDIMKTAWEWEKSRRDN